MRAGPLAAWALALFALGAVPPGCKPPLQSGGVDVMPGASGRLGMLCRWRHGDVGTESFCGEGAAATPARVGRIGKGEARLAGPLAIGRDGDYVLANDEIAIVVDQLGRGTGFAESGGNIVDAADARVGVDELGQIFTYFGVFPRQAIYERLTSGVDGEGTAWIDVSGHELHDAHLLVETRYALSVGARALAITTTLTNASDVKIEGLGLGDAIQWGSAQKSLQHKPSGYRGDFTGPFVSAVGRHVAYAMLGRGGADLASRNGTAWTNTSFASGVALAPGERRTYERALVVTPRGDTLAVATELFFLQGGSPGGAEVALVDAQGRAVTLGDEAALRLAPEGGGEPLTLRATATKAGAPIAAELPPGRYVVSLAGGGRRSTASAPIVIEPGQVARAALTVTAAGHLAVRVVDADRAEAPCPAKIQILDSTSAEPIVEPVLAKDGTARIALPSGRYHVVASRGPEWSIASVHVDVGEGEDRSVPLELRHVVDTRGYVACDLHQHTAISADAGVSMAERIVSNVVEGVECAVASEHNAVVDARPLVRELGLDALFRSIPGDELTTDASREPFGHANVFPLAVDPGDPRGGAPAVRDRTAKEVFDAIRAIEGEHVLQINHPRLGRTGYFEQLAFDAARGVGTKPGYDPAFDAVEVWSGRHVESRAKVLDDLWALLRTSHPVTPTANTDTHGIVGEEAGYPRTLIAVPDDDAATLDVGAVVHALRKTRDVALTNGPFVTLRAGPIAQGGLVSLKKGAATTFTLAVEWPQWMDVSEIAWIVGGVEQPAVPVSGAATHAGALRAEQTLSVQFAAGKRKTRAHRASIELAEDTFITAVARGTRPLWPVLRGDAAGIMPFAMTAPIWIDANGDGRSLGREAP